MDEVHLVADIETDGLDYTKIHCVCTHLYETGEKRRFTDMFLLWVYVIQLSKKYSRIVWVFHNGIGFDIPAINKHTKLNIQLEDVVDTFVLSRLRDYNFFNTHSLKEIGEFLGTHKGDFEGPWDKLTPEMLDYCEQDVEVTVSIFRWLQPFLKEPHQQEAIQLEHQIAWLCNEMFENGFPFDQETANQMLFEIDKEMNELEQGFKAKIKPKRVEKKRVKHRKNKDGSINSRVQSILDTEPDWEIVDGEVIVYELKEFNPGSPQDRIDIMWKYGWKPVDKTDGYKKKLREGRGW